MVPILMKVPPNGPSYNASKLPGCAHYLGQLDSLIPAISVVQATYACCRRVLGCHPLPSCAGEALGMT